MKPILIALVRGYQITLSPFFGQHCRFAPTCSHYAIESLHKHGAVKGFWLTVRRLSRCHPWHVGGYDPVPSADTILAPSPAPKTCCHVQQH